MKKLLLLTMAMIMTATAVAEAQQRPKPRPPWQDVCCGGPCCAKPQKPGR